MRMDLVRAAIGYACERRLDRHLVDYLSSWLDDSRQLIRFDCIYPAHHWQSMHDLDGASLLGVYWFVNHNDSAGSLSTGQAYDLAVSLDAIGERQLLRAGWPQRAYTDFYRFLVDRCTRESVGLIYSNHGVVRPPPPAPAFAYVDVQSVGAALGELERAGIVKPVVEAYNPASPH